MIRSIIGSFVRCVAFALAALLGMFVIATLTAPGHHVGTTRIHGFALSADKGMSDPFGDMLRAWHAQDNFVVAYGNTFDMTGPGSRDTALSYGTYVCVSLSHGWSHSDVVSSIVEWNGYTLSVSDVDTGMYQAATTWLCPEYAHKGTHI